MRGAGAGDGPARGEASRGSPSRLRHEPVRGSFSNRYTRRALVTLASVAVLVMYAEMMLLTALPSIRAEFGVSPAAASWVLTIYMLTGAVATPIMGKLGDLYGKKRILVVATSVYTVAVTVAGFAWSFPALLAFRAFQGIGLSMFPLAFGLIRDEFPPQRMAIAQGIVSSMFGVGAGLGIIGGSAVTNAFDWRTTYHTVTPLALMLLAVIAGTIRESPVRASGRIDWAGAAALGAGLVGVLLGLTQGEHWGWSSPRVAALFGAGLLSLGAYVVIERRVKDPMLPLPILRSRNVAVANVALLLVAFAMFSVYQSVAFLVQSPPPVGFSANVLESGLIQGPQALMVLLTGPIAGWTVARLGPKRPTLMGLLTTATGLGLLALLHGSPLEVALGVIVMGAGTSATMVGTINMVILAVPPAYTGVATGINSLFRLVGGVIGPVAAGVWMTAYTLEIPSGGTIPAESAYLWIFGTSAAAVLVAALVVSRANDARPGGPPKGERQEEPATATGAVPTPGAPLGAAEGPKDP